MRKKILGVGLLGLAAFMAVPTTLMASKSAESTTLMASKSAVTTAEKTVAFDVVEMVKTTEAAKWAAAEAVETAKVLVESAVEAVETAKVSAETTMETAVEMVETANAILAEAQVASIAAIDAEVLAVSNMAEMVDVVSDTTETINVATVAIAKMIEMNVALVEAETVLVEAEMVLVEAEEAEKAADLIVIVAVMAHTKTSEHLTAMSLVITNQDENTPLIEQANALIDKDLAEKAKKNTLDALTAARAVLNAAEKVVTDFDKTVEVAAVEVAENAAETAAIEAITAALTASNFVNLAGDFAAVDAAVKLIEEAETAINVAETAETAAIEAKNVAEAVALDASTLASGIRMSIFSANAVLNNDTASEEDKSAAEEDKRLNLLAIASAELEEKVTKAAFVTAETEMKVAVKAVELAKETYTTAVINAAEMAAVEVTAAVETTALAKTIAVEAVAAAEAAVAAAETAKTETVAAAEAAAEVDTAEEVVAAEAAVVAAETAAIEAVMAYEAAVAAARAANDAVKGAVMAAAKASKSYLNGSQVETLIATVSMFNEIDDNDEELIDAFVSAMTTKAESKKMAEQLTQDVGAVGAVGAVSMSAVSSSISNHQMANIRTASRYNNMNKTASFYKETGISSGNSTINSGVWIKAFGSDVEMDERDLIAGYNADVSGVTFGLDSLGNENTRFGLAFSISDINVDGKGTGSTKLESDSYQFSLYGTKFIDDLFINGMAGIAFNNNATSRVLNIGQLDRTIVGNFDSIGYNIKIDAGMPMISGNSNIIPKLGMGWSVVSSDKYTETGGGDANQEIETDDQYVLELTAGVATNWKIGMGNLTLVPEIRAGISADLLSDESEAIVNFTNSSTSYITTGADVSVLGGTIGGGFSLSSNGGIMEISANYDAKIKEDFISHNGSLKARYNF